MNPHQQTSISPMYLIKSLVRNRELIWQMSKREVLLRYRGSMLGIVWAVATPIFLLTVYTFVFSIIFQSRWSVDLGSKYDFALILFAGLIVFNVFAECINRAPSLIVGSVNLVKKVVFPLEVLPCVALGAALFHVFMNFAVLLVFYFLVHHSIPWTVIFFPLIMLPLIVFILGLSWFLSSLGVYIRDMGQFIGLVVTVIMFLSPVFYPASAVPEKYQIFIHLNPLAVFIEQVRMVLIYQQVPSLSTFIIYSLVSCLVACGGYAWFQRTRKGFGDVL